MAKERFIDKKFTAESITRLRQCTTIIDAYARDGYDLSLRQLYYQLVTKNFIKNDEKNYKAIGNLISDARLAGLVDWDMIRDRGRTSHTPSTWESPAQILRSAARGFRMDLWRDQPVYCEVMVEKQALEGVLSPLCARLGVTFTSNKGYSSSSALYDIGKRLAAQSRDLRRRRVVVFYLGDHDPSGIDMTRDVAERLRMFSGRESLQVKRLALNMDQIDAAVPPIPPNPAKMTDSRADDYVQKFGRTSWELDALDPGELARIVTTAVAGVRDQRRFDAAQRQEDEYVKQLEEFAARFDGSAVAAAVDDDDDDDDDQ